jgi:hypothetical protein
VARRLGVPQPTAGAHVPGSANTGEQEQAEQRGLADDLGQRGAHRLGSWWPANSTSLINIRAW